MTKNPQAIENPEEIERASRRGWVYLIRCKPNGRVYVGSSVTPDRRFYLHRRDLSAGKHHSPKLQAAWNKYGPDAFVFEIVGEAFGLKALLAAEQSLIDRYAANSMNCARYAGSPLGVLRTEQQKAAMSEIKKAFNKTPAGIAAAAATREKNLGRRQSQEERAMRSAALKGKRMGRQWTQEQRDAHSIALRGRSMPPVSDATRAAISAATKGRPAHVNAIEASRNRHKNWIADELPAWIEMRQRGMSFREIEKQTGRCRRVIARECERLDK